MSHDFYAYHVGKEDNEVAHISIGYKSPVVQDLYAALGVAHLNGGCSGVGEDVVFSKAELEAALSKVPDDFEHSREVAFLRACIASRLDEVAISFC